MIDFIQILSTILPMIASSLLILVLLINLYLKIRRKFPISVNCWFCNSWTRVPYDDCNSFNCPTCSQYNGFTKDGDYNKIIPEQHDELMNKSTSVKTNKSIVSNGLCTLCNNNQRLKIFQLAHFVPLIEENYDIEIEHFQEQLEKAYKLCKKCDKVLKRTLQSQNAWIFGNKLKNMYSNGMCKITNQLKKKTNLTFISKLGGIFTVLLVLSLVFTTIFSIKVFTKSLQTHIPIAYLSIYKNIVSGVSNAKIVNFNLLAPYFTKHVRIEPYFIISAAGLVYQGLRAIFTQKVTATIINQLLCWVILTLISWVRFNKSYTAYILFVEAFSCIYLLTTAFSIDANKSSTSKISGKSIRKLVKNLEYTCTDFSECSRSDFENISTETGTDSSSFSTVDVPLNTSFTTAGSVLNSSVMSVQRDTDINKSLNNLHLGFKSPKSCSSISSFAVKRPKPVLSPPKFQNLGQNVNSWVAGGFWRDSDGILLPQRSNLSRSSSESSGFGSQHNEQFVPFDRISLNSDCNRPVSPNLYTPNEFRRNNTTVYPNLQQNNMLLIHRVGSPGLIKFNEIQSPRRGLFENWSDRINAQATQSFRDLSLHSNN